MSKEDVLVVDRVESYISTKKLKKTLFNTAFLRHSAEVVKSDVDLHVDSTNGGVVTLTIAKDVFEFKPEQVLKLTIEEVKL